MHGSLTEPEISQRSIPLQSQDREESQPEHLPLQIEKPKQPAIPVALCFMFGIALDRILNLPWMYWMIAGAGTAACWVVYHLKKNNVVALASLLGCCLLLGGARHHLFWSTFQSNEIYFFATEKSQLVNLTGTIATPPRIYPRKEGPIPSAWGQPDRTKCLVRCESILAEGSRIPVSGLAQLNVSGHLLHVEVGDEVQVRGWLSHPRGPVNPGEYDYRNYLRRRGVRAVLYAEYPEAVHKRGRANVATLHRFAGRMRNYAESLFVKHLNERNVGVASALILGQRAGLDHEIRDQFASSGTMHLLAISGLHVGILVGFVWVCCRLLNLSPLATAGVIVTVVVGNAFLTGARPSVIRATIIVVAMVLGRPWYRKGSLGHLLAFSALVILAWNPTDLFDVGAQLSFLSMVAIVWSGNLKIGGRIFRSAGDDDSHVRLPKALFEKGRYFCGWLIRGYVMVGAIGLFTLPLIAANFHVVSPVGFFISVLLSPLLVLVLWSGHLLLLCDFFIPFAAPVPGFVFDQGLTFLLSIVENASQLSLGHRYVPGPANWWLIGFYLILAVFVAFYSIRPVRRWGFRGLCTWILLGLILVQFPPNPSGLRCTFLAVGHGVAILIELPNGKTLLYDAGSLRNGAFAGRTVQNALWDRGLSRIDTMVLSHADVDHFNGVPTLLKTIPIGSLMVAPQFLDFDQQAVEVVYKTAARENVPFVAIGRKNRLLLDQTVIIEVLHPEKHSPKSEGHAEDDNANSVVLLIEYAGRRILLTGDVAGEGLAELLNQQPPRNIDVMLSPHHGSPSSNTAELARWARPDFVTVSAGRNRRLEGLQATYGSQTKLFSTALHGAVTFRISPGGTLHYSQFSRSSKKNANPSMKD